MTAKATYIFATRADLEPGLRAVEQERPLRYVLRGLFQSPNVEPLSSALEIPNLGISRQGDWLHIGAYLVLDAATPIQVRPVPQRRGGVLHAVDEQHNPTAIRFRAGGFYEERCLLSGEILGVGDPRSLDLYHTFTRHVLKGFERIQSFSVGPEAARLLDSGGRLTQNVNAPAECDLRRPRQIEKPRVAPGYRLSLEASWEYLKALGYEMPEDEQHRPFVPGHIPNYDDEERGLSFFRTGLEEEKLEDLTLPRTYFSRSEFQQVSFRNTDLSESRMCWNDWVKCDFTDAVLRRADLRASEYIRCRFVRADLVEADLRCSSFQGCDFTDARMRGARLARPQGARLKLSKAQQSEIDWQDDDGPEPFGG